MKTRLPLHVLGALGLALSTACRESSTSVHPRTSEGIRIVNAYTQPVDVLVDGALVASGVPAGRIDRLLQSAGAHLVALRPTGTTATVSVPLTTAAGELRTIVALRSGTALAATELDDTNAVPAGRPVTTGIALIFRSVTHCNGDCDIPK